MTIKFDSFSLYLSTPGGLEKQFAKETKKLSDYFRKCFRNLELAASFPPEFECTEKMRSAVLRTWWLGDFCSYWPDFLDWSMSHQSEVSVQHFPQTVCGKASALRLQLPRLRVQHGGNVKQHSHRVNVQLFSFGRFGRSVNVLDGPGGILTHTGCLKSNNSLENSLRASD